MDINPGTCGGPAVARGTQLRRRQAIEHEGLGMFVFPPQSNTDFTQDEVPCSACSAQGVPICTSSAFADEVLS